MAEEQCLNAGDAARLQHREPLASEGMKWMADLSPSQMLAERLCSVPAVSDRIAQTVIKQVVEPVLDSLFHEDSYGYRPGKSARQRWRRRVSAAGNMHG